MGAVFAATQSARVPAHLELKDAPLGSRQLLLHLVVQRLLLPQARLPLVHLCPQPRALLLRDAKLSRRGAGEVVSAAQTSSHGTPAQAAASRAGSDDPRVAFVSLSDTTRSLAGRRSGHPTPSRIAQRANARHAPSLPPQLSPHLVLSPLQLADQRARLLSQRRHQVRVLRGP